MVEDTPASRAAAEFFRVARRQPVRNRALALVLNGLFFGCLAAAVGGALYITTQSDLAGGADRFVLSFAVFIAALLVFPLHHLANRLGAASAADVLRDDPRSPVLFLRGFAADRDDFLSRWIKRPASLAGWRKDDGVTHEEKLVHALRSVGPVVAIGRPGETLQTLGASRLYVNDADWRVTVERLASDAALTVIQLGDSPGLWWELEHALKTLPPERLLLYLPASHENRAGEAYRAFRHRAQSLLPRPLPPDCAHAAFIAFGPDWRPVFLRRESPLLFDARAPVLLFAPGPASLKQRQTQRDIEALATVFSQVGPVIMLGDSGLQPSGAIESWMPVPAAERAAILEDECWGSGPVILYGGTEPDDLDLLSSIIGRGDPQRLLVFVPPFSGADKTEQHARLRRAICASARCQERFETAAAAYLLFDRTWRPQTIRRRWFASPGWLAWLRRRGRAVRRVHALLLKPLFRRHGRHPPGRWTRRFSWLLPAILLLLIVLAAVGSKRPIYSLRLTAEHDITTNWQGLVWGLPADQVTSLMTGLDIAKLETAGSELRSLETGRSMAVAGHDLVMLLTFLRKRLVGAGLYTALRPEERAESIGAELTRLYGPPARSGRDLRWIRGPVVVQMQLLDVETAKGPRTTLYVIVQNTTLIRELLRE